MNRGYPSRWLVAALNARGISFCMRVEEAGNTGFACARDFLCSDEHERIVTLAAPDQPDAADYECPATAQTLRLVRHIASTGKVRVLMTNLLNPIAFPYHEFGDLYHQRWRIEEAFKRFKWQLMFPTEAAGEMVRALAWLGPEKAAEAFRKLRVQLPPSELKEVASARSRLPTWMAQEISGLMHA